MYGASGRRSEIGREHESPKGNSPAWLRCTDKVVQLNEPQARHHLPNRMARLDTSDGDDNLTSHRLSRHRPAHSASAARSVVADPVDRPATSRLLSRQVTVWR